MASKDGAKKSRPSPRLSTIHPRAAGIDIGSRFHVVAVPPDLTDEPVQTFNSFTGDLHRLADWLVASIVEGLRRSPTPARFCFSLMYRVVRN